MSGKSPRLAVAIVLTTLVGCTHAGGDWSVSALGEDRDRADAESTDPGDPSPVPFDPGAGANAGDAGAVANESSVAESIDASCADADAATSCADPSLGGVGPFEFVSLTGDAVDACIGGDRRRCSLGGSTFLDPSDVALDYGNFPFSKERSGEYFFAVVAAGYEDAGFFEGAAGNLSDAAPSSVEGDRGSGDTLADRTIVVDANQFPRFPASHGTHDFSFPPSQFMTIHLAPFDTTPTGKYVLAICPKNAASRCDCAFDAFNVSSPVDAGLPGTVEAGDAGNATEGGNGGAEEAPDAATADETDGNGFGADAGTVCNDL